MDKIDTLLNKESFKKGIKMTDKRILAIFILLLFIPMVISAPSFIFKQDEITTLKISCFDTNQSLCTSGTSCYVNVQYPDLSTDLVKNGLMTFETDYYSYSLPVLNKSGIYSVVTRCIGSENAFSTFNFEVTPTGTTQTSILENPMILIFGILALVLIGMGAYMSIPWFGFIGSLMFLLGGIYTMIFGFNNITDLYSRGIAITFIGLGLIFMFAASYEWIWGGRND